VVEAAVRRTGGPFTPNELPARRRGQRRARALDRHRPEHGRKSTFLRQNALLAVLAQAGCFVPARRLRLGVVDKLFSRVGAGDDLARGRSTFMTEMVETAAILTQATERSLVVLDEIGRGTATYDGLAIAWACAEALHDVNRCRRCFATHYHELARLEGRLAYVSNLSMRAKEWNGDLVFCMKPARERRTVPTACRWPSSRGCPAAVSPAPATYWSSWRAEVLRPAEAGGPRPGVSKTCRCSPPPSPSPSPSPALRRGRWSTSTPTSSRPARRWMRSTA
jgi:hypothetical protein